MGRSLIHHPLDDIIPFIRSSILELGISLDVYEVKAVLSASEEWSEIVLVCFLVRFAECLTELLNKLFRFLLILQYLVLNDLLSLELLLDFRIELSLNEYSFPFDLVGVDVEALATHEVVNPLAFI